MGWADWPWYTLLDDFAADFDVAEWFGINVFLRDGDRIHRSYYTTSRAAEDLSSVWGLLDITPFGRQEEWQDAPEGVPQDPTGAWTRRHDSTRRRSSPAAGPGSTAWNSDRSDAPASRSRSSASAR